MTVRERIIAIRLSEKINKNPEFSEYIGVSAKMERTKQKNMPQNQNALKKVS